MSSPPSSPTTPSYQPPSSQPQPQRPLRSPPPPPPRTATTTMSPTRPSVRSSSPPLPPPPAHFQDNSDNDQGIVMVTPSSASRHSYQHSTASVVLSPTSASFAVHEPLLASLNTSSSSNTNSNSNAAGIGAGLASISSPSPPPPLIPPRHPSFVSSPLNPHTRPVSPSSPTTSTSAAGGAISRSGSSSGILGLGTGTGAGPGPGPGDRLDRPDSRGSFSRLLAMSELSDEGAGATPVSPSAGPSSSSSGKLSPAPYFPSSSTSSSHNHNHPQQRDSHNSNNNGSGGGGGGGTLGILPPIRDTSVRGSMLLYRLASSADPFDDLNADLPLLPPSSNARFSSQSGLSAGAGAGAGAGAARYSVVSSSGASTYSFESKYPTLGLGAAAAVHHPHHTLAASAGSSGGYASYGGTINEKFPSGKGAFLPYVYDPSQDQDSPPDADDLLHDPDADERWWGGAAGAAAGAGAGAASRGSQGGAGAGAGGRRGKGWARGAGGSAGGGRASRGWGINWRGLINIVVLTTLVTAVIALFTLYPIISFFRTNPRNLKIDNNIQVNATGQVPDLPNLPRLIDQDTPAAARTRTGWDGLAYELVFSDEFNEEGRTFWPGDDPYWEAVDLWYGATQDLEWYTPEQVTTTNGSLRLRLDTADPTSNHGLSYKSGMIQSWNKFCFTRGYIEVNVSFPGANSDVSGYWPGAWTMGNLARPGYGASTDGVWPYSYTSCDTGTFPNQTNPDGQTPPAALHSDFSRDKYNFELSWLPGQRLSACTCPASAADHPGPLASVGRGAPEIDILEAQKNKLGEGGKVSQSAQFAPFNHDYVSGNDTSIATFFTDQTKQNTYQGSALQQAVSALTTVPDRAYAGTGAQFITIGFEYWGDPNDPSQGYIMWMVDGQPSYRVTAAAVGPDPTVEIQQRLISREPMGIILNLGMSTSFQNVDLTTMTFPGDFLVDYVRVYQRTGEINIGCDPADYPTSNYIDNHMEAYTNPNLTFWRSNALGNGAGYNWPKNSLWDGC